MILLGLLVGGCRSSDVECADLEDPCVRVAEIAGECVVMPEPDGTECDPRPSECAVGTCRDGVCVGTRPADPGPCREVVGCEVVASSDGGPCDDGNACTFDDACRAGECVGAPTTCDPPTNACAAARCDPLEGCVVEAVPDGTACDDAELCNGPEQCRAGDCVSVCTELCFEDATGSLIEERMSGIMGGGGALLDADEDGVLDLVLAGELDVLVLYRGNGDLSFERIDTIDSGIVLDDVDATPVHGEGAARPLGAIAADFDRDGHDDVFVLIDGPNQLFYGNGDGTFERGAFDPVVEYSTSAAAADVDGDGWLDLYVGNYIAELREPGTHLPWPNRFYFGSARGFVEADLGLAGLGTTLATLFTDFDADGDPDLFVCNDFGDTIEPNQLFRNDGGTFTEVTSREGARLAFFCMGFAAGDYDRDGDRDVFVSNLGENALLRRLGDRYADVATTAGVHGPPDECSSLKPSTSWAASFADFDLDGWLDLYVTNGYVGYGDSALDDPHRVYRHRGMSLTFDDVSFGSGVMLLEEGRGAVFGDLDRDGDVDVVQFHSDGPPLVLRNESPRRGGWLRVELPGRIGTEVTVDLGDARLVRELRRHEGYASGQPAELYFGLGDAATVDVLARYPDGSEQSWVEVTPDTVLRVPAPPLR